MKTRNERSIGIVPILGELLIGIFLFWKPVGFTAAIITIFGILLVAAGIVQLIAYFRSAPSAEMFAGVSLSRALLEIIGGLFCVLNPDWLIATFPALTMLYGIGMLIFGVVKLENAINLMRLRMPQWKWSMLSAVLTLVFALVILANPFSTTILLWRFVAVSLIIEAVVDIVVRVLFR